MQSSLCGGTNHSQFKSIQYCHISALTLELQLQQLYGDKISFCIYNFDRNLLLWLAFIMGSIIRKKQNYKFHIKVIHTKYNKVICNHHCNTTKCSWFIYWCCLNCRGCTVLSWVTIFPGIPVLSLMCWVGYLNCTLTVTYAFVKTRFIRNVFTGTFDSTLWMFLPHCYL
jgi:hypothetical protein